MNLLTIIDEFDAGTLTTRPDAVLEAARLDVEYAQQVADLKPFRQTLLAIECVLVKTLSIRYGCND